MVSKPKHYRIWVPLGPNSAQDLLRQWLIVCCRAHDIGHLTTQEYQQIRPDGVDRAQPQRVAELVPAFPGDLRDRSRLFEHALRLLDNALADRCHRDFGLAALKQCDTQLIFELFNGNAQCWLTDEHRLGRATEMSFPGERNNVAQFSQSHGPDHIIPANQWLARRGH